MSIDEESSAAKRRASLIAEARAAWQQVKDSGESYDADEVHAYIRARIAGKSMARPMAKCWRSQ